jgi:hypothetical protein
MNQPPRRARPSTPHPTVPPPLPDEPSAVKRVVRGIEPWQKVLAALVVVFAAGGTTYSLAASKADVTALDQVRVGAAANLASSTAGTTAQLGALAAQVQDLRTHQAAVDATLAALTDTAGRLSATTDRMFLQLVEVARTTGARQVPAAPPPERTPP